MALAHFGKTAAAKSYSSHPIYATSLVLYPHELRREFGAEMVEVFDEQVSEAYSRSGFPRLLRVWFSATREFVTIAFARSTCREHGSDRCRDGGIGIEGVVCGIHRLRDGNSLPRLRPLIYFGLVNP
jgi:hypothetical protein